MSTSHAQETRSDQSGKRRKRKERAATRTPEPKNIVSGAGQPLDLSVRRELEEHLGHDFSRVRLHTDPDAGALTEMLGADAVAVGQDIFFREGAYRPGTQDGQRLLAHELLHTVQNPHGLGVLRAGRDLGEVSLPQQALEREAESAAQEAVREGESETQVEEGQATPGWLRYATVDADRNRLEQLDPATLVERLANSVVRSLRGDPEDRSKRTRRQLARLPEELQDTVLERLETRLLSSEHERVLDLVDEVEAYDDLERESLDAPAVESDPVEALRYEREAEQRSTEERLEEERQPAPAPGPEKDQDDAGGALGSTPVNGTGPQDGEEQDQGAAPEAPAAVPSQEPSSAPSASSTPASSGGKSEGGGKETAGSDEGKEGQEQQSAPAASEEESAARNRPGAVDALVAGQQLKQEDKGGSQKPTGSPSAQGTDAQLSGASSTLDGVRNQDLDGSEEKSDEDLFGSGSESEVEAGGERSAWDVKLQPEDFLPAQDLDVSAVPTADTLDPTSSGTASTPSFPAPPVTRAEQVQAERDAEDAAAESEPEQDDAGPADAEPSAEADRGAQGGTQLGGLDLEQAAELRPVTDSRDPKSGADPKAGPVAAQTAVQEAPGTSEAGSDAKEAAGKEEKGTPAGGDTAAGAQGKASPQAVAGNAAAPDPAAKEEQKRTDAAPAGRSEPTADSQAPSPARDTHVSGGSNVDTSAGPSGSQESGPSPSEPVSRTESPAPKAAEAPEPTIADAAPSAAKAAPAPKAAASEPAPAAKGSRGGGGGGGGAKGAVRGKGKKDSGVAPNLSGVAPEAGLSTASKLKPHKALQAMSGVSGSVDRTVGDEHKTLAAAPPSMERPAGAPQTLEGKPKADAPAEYSQDPAAKSEAPEDEKAEVEGAKEPEGQIEAEKAEEPGGWDTFKMALGFGIGKVLSWVGFEVDASELAAKFAGLPTKDEALKNAQAGNAPGVEMQGAAEQTAGEQGTAVDAKGQDTVTTGRDDAARPMGENQVYPNAPKEQMTAKVPGGQGGGSVPDVGAGTGAVPPEAASEVAEHEQGPQFQAAFSDGQKGMSEGRQTKDRGFRDSQQKHKVKVDAEIAANTESQAGEREKAMEEVTAERADWRTEQDAELKTLGTKKTERHEKVRTDVEDKEKKTDEDVVKEKEDGDKKIKDENTKAEQDAEKKRDDSVEDSGNWVSRAFDWIKQKVIEIKDAIVRVIKAARDAVVGFIKNFKETVERWINEARAFVVDAIKNLIDDLIEFAKAMVRGIIELANRIRKFITDLIAAAIALVTRLAAALKQAVTDLLDAIGKLLSSILDLLKKMLQDVLKAVVDAIKSVMNFAAKLLSALGDFMLIAVDFLSDPGGWLGGAKSSAVDGAKNHLFREVQAAVKEWFRSKIEEVLGIPKAIIEKLIKGGFTLEKIVKETWDAIVPQLPLIIGEIVITKVIAKLIPGAGWAMAVIDAIKVAIGALGEILRAVGAVITWLKAVRQGGAGILFAKAVAAGIVALLELAYEALLSGIGKYVAKVGRRLKEVAANLGKDKDKDTGGDKGKDKDGTGSDGKGGDKKNQEQDPKNTSPPGSRPTPTRPPKPGAKPDLTKPRKPNNTPGKDKDDTKPDTRPTPSPKPKPKPPARPKTEPDTKPKPASAPQSKAERDPGTSPRPKEDTRDRPTDDTDSARPKLDDKNPARPKNTEPARPKRDEDSKNATEPKHRKGDDKPSTHKPDKDSPTRSRSKSEEGADRVGRPKREKSRDDRKKDENSQESKDDRLRKIIARIRPLIHDKVEDRMRVTDFRHMLAGLKGWYRLTSLTGSGDPEVTLNATLNPSRDFMKARRDKDEVFLNDLAEDDLPAPIWPNFSDTQASSISAKFLSSRFRKTGQDANLATPGNNPPGWKYIDDRNMSNQAAWVRMHLIPEGIGGMASGNNLVPARRQTNGDFANNIELEARDSMPSPHELMWYHVKVDFHSVSAGVPPRVDGYPESFPRMITAKYGGYEWNRRDPRREHASWTQKVAKKTYKSPDEIRLPDKSEAKKLQINTAGEGKLNAALGGDKRPLARLLAGKTPNGAGSVTVNGEEVPVERKKFGSVGDVETYLEAKKGQLSKDMKAKIPDAVKNLRMKEADADAGIDWYPF